jgi:hypothetical protein
LVRSRSASLGLLDRERAGQQVGLGVETLVMQAPHRRSVVGVPHPGLDLHDVGPVDRVRAECVAQVVEAQRAQLGRLAGRDEASAQRYVTDVALLALDAIDGRSPGARCPRVPNESPRADNAPVDLTAFGFALAKLAARLALPHGPGRDFSGDVLDIVASSVPDRASHNTLARHFEGLGERVALELQPFFDVEFGELPSNEKAAARVAVEDAIAVSEISQARLMEVDATAAKLEALVHTNLRTHDLAPAAVEFAEILLREVCVYIVAGCMALDSFVGAASAELLRRTSEISEDVERAISQVPRQVLELLSDSDPRRFETEYRRALVHRLDQLQLLGLPRSKGGHIQYPLSVAYLTLTASLAGEGRRRRSVDDVLSQHARWVIRGSAGSGKTTLMQWLAVGAAQRSFEGPLRGWNRLVPFYVPLRRFAVEYDRSQPDRQDLPTVHAIARESAGVLSDAVPTDWVMQTLQEGRGLFLIDGLDEVPKAQLGAIPGWIASLTNLFPKCTFVVSSRPSALADVSLVGDGFQQCSLDGLTDAEMDAFIGHWHRAAARSPLLTDHGLNASELQESLRAALATSSELRALATTPLLCALLCALNRDRTSILPVDRLAVYTTALEVLVTLRDTARPGLATPPIDHRQALLLLQDAAYWMIRNGEPVMSRSAFDHVVSRRLESFRHVSTSAERVAQHLIDRSGVLGEPADGEIEFVHLTFRDYLAAKAILAADDVLFLLREARDGRLEELVVFASAMASDSKQQQIFDGLLFDPITPTSQPLHGLHPRRGQEFLALACLEMCTSVPPATAAEIDERVHSLVPPKNAQDARLIAAAGEAAVAALGRVMADVNEREAIHTITALTSTGEASALRVLAGWTGDPRSSVRDAVARAWSAFPSDDFVDQVLRGFRRAAPPPPLTMNARQLARASDLGWARRVRLLSPPEPSPLMQLPHGVEDLEIENYEGVALDFARFEQLASVRINHAPRLQTLSGLTDSTRLERLELAGLPSWSAHLMLPPGVTKVALSAVPELSRLALEGDQLQTLELSFARSLRQLEIGTALRLESLSLRAVPGLTADMFSTMSSLRAASFHSLEFDVAPDLRGSELIEDVTVVDCRGLRDLRWLPSSSALKNLRLVGCWKLDDLTPLRHLDGLQELDLSFCRGLTDLSPLADLAELKRVDLTGCWTGLNCSPLGNVDDIAFPYPA